MAGEEVAVWIAVVAVEAEEGACTLLIIHVELVSTIPAMEYVSRANHSRYCSYSTVPREKEREREDPRLIFAILVLLSLQGRNRPFDRSQSERGWSERNGVSDPGEWNGASSPRKDLSRGTSGSSLMEGNWRRHRGEDDDGWRKWGKRARTVFVIAVRFYVLVSSRISL